MFSPRVWGWSGHQSQLADFRHLFSPRVWGWSAFDTPWVIFAKALVLPTRVGMVRK